MTNQVGKLIVLEGLDGSGKSVQFQLLYNYLLGAGYPVVTVDFPDYADSFFGGLVGRYLNGDFGDIHEVSPYSISLLYAGDRLEARPRLHNWLAEGKWILANRYVGSNMAYQSAKLPEAERAEFLGWLKRLEFEANQLPLPNLVLYLNAPVTTSQRMVSQKTARSYTNSSHDIHERNAEFLQQVEQQYHWLCQNEPGWQSLNVTDNQGELLPREVVHRQILQLLGV